VSGLACGDSTSVAGVASPDKLEPDGGRGTHPAAVPSDVVEPQPLHPPFRVLEPLSSIVRAFFVACAVVAGGSLFADVAQYVFVDELFADPTNSTVVDRLVVSDVWQAILSVLIFLVAVPTAVAFLVWLQRAYLNLPTLGVEQLRFSSGWVIGAWFVPLLALVWPKMIVDSTWRDSDPDGPEVVVVPEEQGQVPLSIHLWWGCLLAMVGCWALSIYLVNGSLTSPGRERLGYALEIASSATAIAAAVLAFGLVGDIADRQRRRAERLGIDLRTGYRPVPTVVQPWVDQVQVEGYPPPPSVPPVATRAADTSAWWTDD